VPCAEVDRSVVRVFRGRTGFLALLLTNEAALRARIGLKSLVSDRPAAIDTDAVSTGGNTFLGSVNVAHFTDRITTRIHKAQVALLNRAREHLPNLIEQLLLAFTHPVSRILEDVV